ncbi:MAG: toll/interleukin-1 receptor domain-containing protein [Deltaproteobacteria bacterium]|nr:toll/interleukin-1 receptor domain-containing protein [Deltaproteobacteria bacterium]
MTRQYEYDVFLSHDSVDKKAVEAIAKRLRNDWGLEPFLDKWHLIPGEPWQPALADAVRNSKTAAVLYGPKSRGAWRDLEKQLALLVAAEVPERRIIPVLLPKAERESVRGFVKLNTWVDLADEDGFLGLVAGIKGCRPADLDRHIRSGPRLSWSTRTWKAVTKIFGVSPVAPAGPVASVDPGDAVSEVEAAASSSHSAESDSVWEEPIEPETTGWNAEEVLRELLADDNSGVVQRLDVMLPGTATAGNAANGVARKIDGLGHGPGPARKLVEACYDVLSEIDASCRCELPGAVETVRALLSRWLPRRCGDRSTVRRRYRHEPAANEVHDLVAQIGSPVLVEALVAGEDGRPMQVVSGPRGLAGIGSLPVPVAEGAQILSEDVLADNMADSYSGQLLGQLPSTREGKRDGARLSMAFERRQGTGYAPKHFAPWPHEVPAAVLRKLKAIYPPLRIVYRTGTISEDEGAILNMLERIFGRWQ